MSPKGSTNCVYTCFMQDTKKRFFFYKLSQPFEDIEDLSHTSFESFESFEEYNLEFWNYVEGFAIWKDVMSKYVGKL